MTRVLKQDILKQFKSIFYFFDKSLEPDNFEKVILPYLEKVYTFENAAYNLWSLELAAGKLRARLNNDRVKKKLVTHYQNLRIQREISEDSWFEGDETK
ncbi:hypothetical protein RCL_jg23118.t1 [Rhizophagus clarus]|uniref:Uncharacterized protein n=1 Tax=Rhizophagus clarus TaxID=94130 RepID=A0A8H3L3W6_9GLOM|nr:hypothetical protein RCL_jg23118.t1 [Rhizophagus clarus]